MSSLMCVSTHRVGNEAMARWAITHGANVNAASHEGVTALNLAIAGHRNRAGIVAALVESGADVRCEALHTAVTLGSNDVVAYLCSLSGVDPLQRRNEDGMSAEDLARRNGAQVHA